MKSLFLFLLRAYKLTISPFLGQNCRFYPSCSAYADIAIRRHGVIKGSVLAGKRLCKCHPWHAGGVDLVPEAKINTEQQCDVHSETRLKLARPAIGEPEVAIGVVVDIAAQPSNQPHFITE
jgi:putative membrane protein insertion efficiency factor